MYNPAHFAMLDTAAVQDFIRKNPFATLAGIVDGEIQFAYAPVVLDSAGSRLGAARFHLARANPLARIADGAVLKLSIMGAHAYVSPDWYESKEQVPTWNYSAAEASGRIKALNETGLRKLLSDLSAQEERALAPKAPWTLGRVSAPRIAQMLEAIIGFELPFDTLEGKMKLTQNRTHQDAMGTIKGLDARGDGQSRAVAAAMRDLYATKEE